MGYEVIIYVGQISPYTHHKDDKNRFWFQIMSMMDLCKVSFPTPENCPITPIFFYGTDGNTEYIKDRYGTSLVAYPIQEVIKVLEPFKNDDYRRFGWALTMLKSMAKNPRGKHGLIATHVFLYGH